MISEIILNKIDGYVGEPVVGWLYRCKCGKEVVDITEVGIEQIQAGVPYDAVVGVGEYAENRLNYKVKKAKEKREVK